MNKFIKYALLAMVAIPFTLCTLTVVGMVRHSDKEAEKEEQAEVFAVELSDMVADYNDNELRADVTYKGKKIQTTGEVISIEHMLGVPFLRIKPGLRCMLAKDDPKATALNKGDLVTVIGIVKGKSGTIGLRGCAIQ